MAKGKRDSFKLRHLAWIAAMATLSLAVVFCIMFTGPYPNTPLNFAASRQSSSGASFYYLSGLVRCLTAREFIYVFVWLLPLGLVRLNYLPRAWVVASMAAALTALALGAYDDALGNATRAIFSACGPVLSLSVALLLAEVRKPNGGVQYPNRSVAE
jgi:hypothetical protein